MEAIVALIIGALMNGHTADQIQTVQDDLVYVETEIMSLEYEMNDLESATLEGFSAAAAMDQDIRIELGTLQAGDGGRTGAPGGGPDRQRRPCPASGGGSGLQPGAAGPDDPGRTVPPGGGPGPGHR